MEDNFSKEEWFMVSQESPEPDGPYSLRDLDVKNRTGDLNKLTEIHIWKDGMNDWLPINDVPEIKKVFEDCE